MESKGQLEKQLLHLTREFLLEMETERALRGISLAANLERDLGIDSIGRVELFKRIEDNFGVDLPDSVMAQAVCLNDIVPEILKAKPKRKYKPNKNIIQLKESDVDVSEVQTLPEALRLYAINEPERPHIHFQDETGQETIITYGELLAKASAIANGILANGIQAGDTVAIMLPTSAAFFETFIGVQLSGAIPVPIYPPFRPDRIEEYTMREARILNNAEIRMLITFSQAEMLSRILKTYIPSLKTVTTASALMTSKGSLANIANDGDTAAIIQYTSGSTGDPKGVLLTYNNIISNIRSAAKAIKLQPTDLCVSWLPLYHDMGLMSWLATLFFGIPLTIMSPISFLNRPERWLWTIHYQQGTISAGPNFAYELCTKKIKEDELTGLDLSSWRLALNGAEAVNPNTLRRFYDRFKKYGLKKEALYPVYGLAENTVALCFPELDTPPHIDMVSKTALENERKAIKTKDSKNCIEFVSCGKPIPDNEIRIVDNELNVLPERHIGELQFKGPSAMAGYYRRPEETEKIAHEGWYNTGDLAYIADDELFITGRKKDLIIKAGRNLYPEAIEETVNQIQDIRKGCTIAFGYEDPSTGTEKLIIATEAKSQDKATHEKLRQEIVDAVSTNIGVPPDKVVLLAPRTIPKTSSGKLQRSQCKAMYLSGELTGKRPQKQAQFIKLFMGFLSNRVKSYIKIFGKFIYTIYVWTFIILTLLPFWPLIYLLPKKFIAKSIKLWSRMILYIAFCPISAKGKENITKNKVIFAANHASYTDSILLLAILPEGIIFIGKKELAKVPLLNSVMHKLAYIGVDRMDFTKNIEDAQRIKQRLAKGDTIVIFPEGTFTYATGLRQFKNGAFQLAIDTQTPIVPIAISGTRKLLRSYSWLLTPSKLNVTINPPVKPKSQQWSELIRVRNEVRKTIARDCGEPSIDVIAAGPIGANNVNS